MAHLLDILGTFLYIGFRVVILPVLVCLSLFFAALSLLKAVLRFAKWVRRLKFTAIQPSYILARFRFASNK